MGEQKRRRGDESGRKLRAVAARFVTPQLAVLAAAFALFGVRADLPAGIAVSLNIVFYILVAVGMTLSAGFGRSRIFFCLLLLALAETALTAPAPAGIDPAVYRGVVYYFSCLLVPVNLLIFSLLSERSLMSATGRARMGLVLLQLLFVAVVLVSQDKEMLALINREGASPFLSRHTVLPFSPVLVMAAVFAVLFLKQCWKQSPDDNAFFYALPALAAGFHFYGGAPLALPLFFAAAAAMLTIAAIGDSRSIAYLDELTGLPARRAFREELARLDGAYTIAMLDIDHFKQFNDKYGHDVGDDALRLVATLVREVTGGGRAFRYGGEEFAVLFRDKGLADALPHLEEVRRRVAERGFILRGGGAPQKRLKVTISIGAAAGKEGAAGPEAVLKLADGALYRAKENGRNCVWA